MSSNNLDRSFSPFSRSFGVTSFFAGIFRKMYFFISAKNKSDSLEAVKLLLSGVGIIQSTSK
jgi:hypothetical protein